MGILKQALRRVLATSQQSPQPQEEEAPKKRLWVYGIFLVISAVLLYFMDNSQHIRIKHTPIHIPLNNFLWDCQQNSLTAVVIHYRPTFHYSPSTSVHENVFEHHKKMLLRWEVTPAPSSAGLLQFTHFVAIPI